MFRIKQHAAVARLAHEPTLWPVLGLIHVRYGGTKGAGAVDLQWLVTWWPFVSTPLQFGAHCPSLHVETPI
jgi:hypothetical protein